MNRQKLIQETSALQRKYEVKYFPKVKATIQSTVNDVISIVKNSGAEAGRSYLHKQISNVDLTRIVQQMALEVGLRFAGKHWLELQKQKRSAKSSITPNSGGLELKGFGFNQAWVDWIKNYLFRFIVEKITFSVFETTKSVLLNVLNQAIEQGWGIDKTVHALDDLPLSASQAARIVRTEITRATNAGAMAAGSTFDWQQQKEWISAHDDRVRNTSHASHVLLDGQVVDYEDVFRDPVNGQEIRFPGDPLSTAAETINCRCAVAITAKLDENGRLIPKRQSTSVIYPSRIQRQIITI